MPIIFNDLGSPSNDPCGFLVGDQCDAGQYSSWWRTAGKLDSQLAVVALGEFSPADKALALAMRSEFSIFPKPTNIFLKLDSEARTRQIAQLSQRMADFVERIEGAFPEDAPGVPEVPPEVKKPPPARRPTTGPFTWLTTGAVLTVAAIGGGLYYARRQGWL